MTGSEGPKIFWRMDLNSTYACGHLTLKTTEETHHNSKISKHEPDKTWNFEEIQNRSQKLLKNALLKYFFAFWPKLEKFSQANWTQTWQNLKCEKPIKPQPEDRGQKS